MIVKEVTYFIALKKQENLIRDYETALKEVRTLEGMLPICSNCKKIRDDKGYWNQIESYFQKHSKVGFSHSLCPDCILEFYPGYSGNLKVNSEEKEGSLQSD